MKRNFIILLFIFIISVSFSQNLTESEKMARKLFSESLDSFFSGKRYDAKLKLEEAMSNQIYLNDIPYFWYYAAKLDLLLGNINRAKEDLNNILFFSPNNSEAISLLNFIDSLKKIKFNINPEIKIKEIGRIKNIVDSNEKFFIGNDFLIINEYIYILDIENDLIYYTNLENSEENWIRFESIKEETFKPFNMYYDIRTDNFYLSGNSGLYIIRNFSNQQDFRFEKLNNFSNLLLVNFDRVGRFWTYSASNNSILVFDINGKLIEEKKLEEKYVITHGSFVNDELSLLDIKNKQILVFSTWNLEIEKIIPLENEHYPINIISLPYNAYIISYMNDGVYLYQNNLITKIFDFPYLIKYDKGILMKFDYNKYELVLDQIEYLTDIMNYYVFLYSIDFNVAKKQINLKINTVSPEDNFINYIRKKIYITDTEGRYAFNYYMSYKKPKIMKFYNMEYLFLEMLPLIESESIIILKDDENFNYEKYINITNIMPLLVTNTTLYIITDKDLNDEIKHLIQLTGGDIIQTKYINVFENYIKNSYKIIQNISYNLFAPIAPGIRPVKINLQLDSKIISDTMYYYSEGVGIAE
ncbi:hypothetical protein [Marinitoga sp. 38H-ov]|uniref:hypothetical protein n=1 Tax=Marinitoga sp. 38H-ov TaxID=1755814 RepID=UPI0013E9F00A|nr:hypothetical protein [Marinitoga sp. 38H-ov]KAF2956507.1 hypothetical protein AS160_05625 [Marinitoga sp. 38H-ov]